MEKYQYLSPFSLASDEITATPQSSERKSSGVWTKLVDKVKRLESQPNLTGKLHVVDENYISCITSKPDFLQSMI